MVSEVIQHTSVAYVYEQSKL